MEEVQHYTTLAQGELARVTEITLQTLRFNRHQSKPVQVDLSELLHTVMALYTGRILVRNIDADLKLLPSPRVFALEGEIRQVINNLVRNALDANGWREDVCWCGCIRNSTGGTARREFD